MAALLIWIVLLLFPSHVFAARSISITGDKTTLAGNDEALITASPSGFIDGETIYIKGAFYQSGSTNYFGFTKSGDGWTKNSAPNMSQRSVKIGEWDGTIVAKSDFDDSGFKGEGDYLFKLGFYWGSYGSVNWSSNSLSFFINQPDPTPTSTPTSTDRPAPTSTPRPTPTPTVAPPAPTKTPIPTLKPTPTIFATQSALFMDSSESAMVLGSTDPTATAAAIYQKHPLTAYIISLALVGLGFGILSIAFILKK